jgi:hypothetical protein
MPGFSDPAVRAKAKATIAANKAKREGKPAPEQYVDPYEKVASATVPEKGKPETIPPNLFSGFTRRLEYWGEREGYRRRYFNDDGPNINNALQSGWTMIERKDVQLNAAVTPRNCDLGSHVCQHVGTNAAGGPMYAYLMEKPQWLCDQHDYGPGSRHEYHEKLLAQIRGGTLGEKAGERRYSQANPVPGSPSSLPPISLDTKITR